ncbi:hypothetical protein LshimejAT787_0205080 [Lyophyllum shimeji]|uniref:Uncharacterized protein n=1 Tax=Lyophyllum shimeji TaxID=47721 RepID=A0A9P3UIV3_LYOSH|nr:hypothetical protein LshimejAT787_0205080 [Lyophyllum shimeji]
MNVRMRHSCGGVPSGFSPLVSHTKPLAWIDSMNMRWAGRESFWAEGTATYFHHHISTRRATTLYREMSTSHADADNHDDEQGFKVL